MAVVVCADPRPGDQVGHKGADRRIADEHRHMPRRGGRLGRFEHQDGGQIPADEQRDQEQPGDAAETVALRQRLDGLHHQGLAELLGRVAERGFQLHATEEALGRDHDQRVALRTGQIGAVKLALVDRVEHGGFVRIAERLK